MSESEERVRKTTPIFILTKKLFSEQNDFVTIPASTPNSGAVGHHPFQQGIDNHTVGILNNDPILSDVLDACASMEAVLSIEGSAATGKSVKVTEM